MMVFRGKKLQEKNNKKTFILDDNIVKHLKGYEISNHVENCKVSGKGFCGEKQWIKGYVQPTARENPDHMLIHIGTNDRIRYFRISVEL